MAANEGFESSIPSWLINDTKHAWVRSTAEAQAGSYSLKSGAIGDNDHTQFDALINVTSSGTFSFYHKTSSEATYDKLFFFIDGVLQSGFPTSGTPAGWTQFSTTLGTGLHCLQWMYSKDSGGSSGDDAVYIDAIVFPANTDVTDFGESFESGVPGGWTNDATYPWVANTDNSRFGSQGVKSGNVGVGSSTSALEVTENCAAGEAYCWIHVSSEDASDKLIWSIDGVDKATIDGTADQSDGDGSGFIFFKATVAAGNRTFKWRYTKDSASNNGDDIGNVDGFVFPAAAAGGRIMSSMAYHGGLAGRGGIAGLGGGLAG